jgi:branched-subunit amino acid ABC-type transport system permease component
LTPLSDPAESAGLVEGERRFAFRPANAPVAVRLAIALIAVAIALSIARGPVAVGQTTLNGLVAAGYFSLGAVGLTLVFGSLRIINFAHGDLLTLGAYLTIGISSLGLPFWPAAIVAIAATAGVALALDWIVWEPMRRQRTSTLQFFLVAIGLAMVIRYTIQFFAGSQPRGVGQDVLRAITFGPFHLGALQALALIVGVAAASLVGVGLSFTRFGKQIRALADDMALAEVSGVDTRAMVRLVWIVAGALAALAGVLYAAAVGSVNPNFGFLILLSLFTAAVLGGIGNAYGALAGGLVVGLAQEWSTLFFAARWKPVVGFAILILMLLLMPRGIFGSGRARS